MLSVEAALIEKEYQIILASQYPSVYFSSSYQISTNESNAGLISRNAEGGLTTSIVFSLNLFDGFKLNQAIKTKKVTDEMSVISKDQLTNQLILMATNLYEDYKNNLVQIEYLKTSVSLSEQNFEKSKALYDLGQITITDFRIAQREYIQTQVNLEQSFFEAKIILLELHRLSGDIMKKA